MKFAPAKYRMPTVFWSQNRPNLDLRSWLCHVLSSMKNTKKKLAYCTRLLHKCLQSEVVIDQNQRGSDSGGVEEDVQHAAQRLRCQRCAREGGGGGIGTRGRWTVYVTTIFLYSCVALCDRPEKGDADQMNWLNVCFSGIYLKRLYFFGGGGDVHMQKPERGGKKYTQKVQVHATPKKMSKQIEDFACKTDSSGRGAPKKLIADCKGVRQHGPWQLLRRCNPKPESGETCGPR